MVIMKLMCAGSERLVNPCGVEEDGSQGGGCRFRTHFGYERQARSFAMLSPRGKVARVEVG